MGEAKRRREAIEALKARSAKLVPAAEQVGHALKRLATAASGNLGSDCFMHAALGQVLLADLGFAARIVVGEVAWRVGRGDGDVISHTHREQAYSPAGMTPEQRAMAYHAWLVVDDTIVDLTTYQFEFKARMLDAADGKHTTVLWRPDVLVLPLREVASYRQTAAAPEPGVAFYQAHDELLDVLMSGYRADPKDLHDARLLMANPDMQAFGPNDVKDVEA